VLHAGRPVTTEAPHARHRNLPAFARLAEGYPRPVAVLVSASGGAFTLLPFINVCIALGA